MQVAAVLEGLAGRGKRPARAAISREELEKKRQTGVRPGLVIDCHAGLEPSLAPLNDCMKGVRIASQQLQ